MSSNNSWNSEFNSAKGSLLAGNGTRPVTLSVGTDGKVLTADSGQPTGLSWSTTTPFGSINIQKFTASGTYTPTANMKYCIIECVGSGGGGGGTGNTAANLSAAGGAGGGGEYARKIASAATIGVSQTVTIGTAGTAGAAGNNDGGAGGDTSVGVICVAKGGSGGQGNTGAGSGAPGLGGTGGTGDLLVAGGPGEFGAIGTITNYQVATPKGGSTFYSPGCIQKIRNGANQTGNVGAPYGGGGSGGLSYNAGGSQAGAAGATGIVVITEYI